jgi:glycosyltransferase involved in cell wall biosynthesis
MIAQGMISRDIDAREIDINILTPRARAFRSSRLPVVETLPRLARHLPYRLVRPFASSVTSSAFLRTATKGRSRPQGAYIWPNAPLDMIKELKRAGIVTFREMINGPRWRAQQILDDAYARLKLPPAHGLDHSSSELEREELNDVDYAFAPNPMVTASLLATGLPRHKILDASYGWDPQRFRGATHLLPPIKGVTILFVGTICIRKGAHLLLDYWSRSKLPGRLVLAGAMDPAISTNCASFLARDDVKVLDYVSDVGALYRSADIFAFPTLEEGGPQVTYEACGCGLPVVTTPMGAGRIVSNGTEGFVLDAYDAEAWIAAMQNLANDVSLRRAMAAAARDSAELYRWDLVSARRKQQVLERLSSQSPPSPSASIEALSLNSTSIVTDRLLLS